MVKKTVKSVDPNLCTNCGIGKMTKTGDKLECSKCWAHRPYETETLAQKIKRQEAELAKLKAKQEDGQS